MKKILIVGPRFILLVLISILVFNAAEAQNKYLVKITKSGDKVISTTKEGLFDKVYTFDSKYPECVYVNLKNINITKAGADTTGLSQSVLLKPGYAACTMDMNGVFRTKVKFTLGAGSSGYLLGQKLKNGLWKAQHTHYKNELPENKDYIFTTGFELIYETPAGKYGVMDCDGNIIVSAEYDEFRIVTDKLKYYDRSNMEYKSLEECFKTNDLTFKKREKDGFYKFIEFRKGDKKDLYEFGGKPGQSEKNMHRNFRKLGTYHLSSDYVIGGVDFIYLEDDNGPDIITSYYKNHYYAMLEKVRRDTLAGGNSYWYVTKDMDLSKPFNEAAVEEARRKREATALVDAVKGTYELVSWKEVNSREYRSFGPTNYVSIIPNGTAHVDISVTFEGILNYFAATDGIEATLKATGVTVTEGKMEETTFAIGAKPVNGFFFTMPGLNTEPVRGKIKSFSGYYDPSQKVLHLYGERHGFAGSLEIVAKKKN